MEFSKKYLVPMYRILQGASIVLLLDYYLKVEPIKALPSLKLLLHGHRLKDACLLLFVLSLGGTQLQGQHLFQGRGRRQRRHNSTLVLVLQRQGSEFRLSGSMWSPTGVEGAAAPTKLESQSSCCTAGRC